MTQEQLDQAYLALCEKAKRNIMKIGEDLYEYPEAAHGQYFEQNKAELRRVGHIFSWTQSFFTGMAALSLEETGDLAILRRLNTYYDEFRKKVFDTPLETMHDLGFLYTLYSTVLYKLTGDVTMRALSVRAAEVLAQRYVPQGGYIRAWGRADGKVPSYITGALAQDQFFQKSEGLAIIDCMMNLPLLFFASQETGNPFYQSIAVSHADTTLQYFVRENYSVCHAYRFAPDGTPQEEFNGCGYSVGSHWARGTAWAIYGFAIAYRYTGLERYFEAAKNMAETFVSLCGKNGMPVWDFCLKDGGEIDTSAAAIAACGMLELLKVRENTVLRQYVHTAAETLVSGYANTEADFPGALSGQNGKGGYACYGDYYLMELLRNLRGSAFAVW